MICLGYTPPSNREPQILTAAVDLQYEYCIGIVSLVRLYHRVVLFRMVFGVVDARWAEPPPLEQATIRIRVKLEKRPAALCRERMHHRHS